jgi:hypothetical protein
VTILRAAVDRLPPDTIAISAYVLALISDIFSLERLFFPTSNLTFPLALFLNVVHVRGH